jgi:hypothetical protein
VTEIRAMRDELVEGRLRREQSDTAHDAAMAEIIAGRGVGDRPAGQSLDAQLTALFDAFAVLADDPTSMVARDTVIRQGRELSRRSPTCPPSSRRIQADADRAVRVAVTDVNAITAELARLNVDMAQSSYNAESIRDRQGVLLSELGKLTSISVLPRSDGGVDVALPSGRALVIGESAYPLETTPDAVTAVRLGDTDVTGDFTGGRLGGLLQVRDSIIPGYTARLDELAYDMATAVNALPRYGLRPGRQRRRDFFTAPATVSGAASSLSVDAALLADSRRVAASATGAAATTRLPGASAPCATQDREWRNAFGVRGVEPDRVRGGRRCGIRARGRTQPLADRAAARADARAGLGRVVRRRGRAPHAVSARVRSERQIFHDDSRYPRCFDGDGPMRVPYDVVRDGLSAINEAPRRWRRRSSRCQPAAASRARATIPAASQLAVAEHAAIANVDAYSRTAGAAAGRLAAADSMLSAFGDKLAAVMVAAMSAQGSSATAAADRPLLTPVTGLRDSLLSDINTTFNGVSLFAAPQSGSPGRMRSSAASGPTRATTTWRAWKWIAGVWFRPPSTVRRSRRAATARTSST